MLKRNMLYVATMILVLGTSGCSDLINRARDWCGCAMKQEGAREEKQTQKDGDQEKKKTESVNEEKKSKKDEKEPVHAGGVTIAPNPELSADQFFVKTVTAEELRHRLETDDRLVLIDAGSKEVYDDCHIVGAINIPLDNLDKGIEGIGRDEPIVLYCATDQCPFSLKAAQLLQQRGYTNVSRYPGGMREWYNLEHPYDGPAERPYLKNGTQK